MAFRRPPRPHESRSLRLIKRLGLGLILLCAILSAALLLLVNGNTIKDPLARLLSHTLGQEVSIARAQFSPLYPHIIKLDGIAVGTLKAGEIYAEYDLSALLFKQELHFYDLYIKDATYSKASLQQELLAPLPFNAIRMDSLRLNAIPVQSQRLQARTATLRFYDALLEQGSTQPKFSFHHGTAALNDVKLDDLPAKNVALNFAAAPQGLRLNELQANLLGGTINATDGLFNLSTGSLKFAQLHLSRLVLPQALTKLARYQVQADHGTLSSIFVALPDTLGTPLNISALSGNFEKLTLKQGKLSCAQFRLTSDELALPELPLAITDATLNGALMPDGALNLNLAGDCLAGQVQTTLHYLPSSHTLAVEKLSLTHNTLEFTPSWSDFLTTTLAPLQLTLGSVDIADMKLLSFVPQWPLSVEHLSLQAEALRFADHKLQGDSAGLMHAQFNNLLYHDLLFTHGAGTVTLSAEGLNFNLPEIRLQRSSVSAVGALSFTKAPSFLILNAPHFAAEDLNSALTGHLWQGEVALQIDLRAPGPFDPHNITQGLQGTFSVSAPSLLISQFGLDLINGGDGQTRTLDGVSLLTALQAADIGLYDLKLDGNLDGSTGTLTLSARTPASLLTARASSPLNSLALSGEGIMTSLPGDSITRIHLGGTLQAPTFTLSPLKRGALRPGLFTVPNAHLTRVNQLATQISAAVSRANNAHSPSRP